LIRIRDFIFKIYKSQILIFFIVIRLLSVNCNRRWAITTGSFRFVRVCFGVLQQIGGVKNGPGKNQLNWNSLDGYRW
jgi:hypothetical protein